MPDDQPTIDVPGVMHADVSGVRYTRYSGGDPVSQYAAWADVYKVEYTAGESPVITIYRRFTAPDKKRGIYRGIVPEEVPFASWSVAEKAFDALLTLLKLYGPEQSGL